MSLQKKDKNRFRKQHPIPLALESPYKRGVGVRTGYSQETEYHDNRDLSSDKKIGKKSLSISPYKVMKRKFLTQLL